MDLSSERSEAHTEPRVLSTYEALRRAIGAAMDAEVVATNDEVLTAIWPTVQLALAEQAELISEKIKSKLITETSTYEGYWNDGMLRAAEVARTFRDPA